MRILTAAQMGEVDRLSTERFHIPSMLLMENAGRSVVDELERTLTNLRKRKILILCGKGNNGGDGFVVARHLALRNADPEVLLLGDPSRLKGDALANWKIAEVSGIRARALPNDADVLSFLNRYPLPDVIVDALFGTGLSKPVGPELAGVIDWVNRAGAKTLVVAVDVPSGLMADSPIVPGPAVKADVTVTFSALKLALVVPPAADLAGRVVVASIGSPASLLEHPLYSTYLADDALAGRVLPARPRTGHKGTFGHVFVAAGSRGKSGAALMTGIAALRSGAGLVTLWLPESLQREIVGKIPELMMEPLPETAEGAVAADGADVLLARLDACDALVLGPGLTTHPETRKFVQEIVHRAGVPVVLDADGINAFDDCRDRLRNACEQAVAITPHPGEMARLLGMSIPEIQQDRLGIACRWSRESGCYTILKGFQTITATPGGAVYINSTGNPGMATGGTGDILAGIVGRFTAGWKVKRSSSSDALGESLASAVYVHGLAGDLAAEEKGMESLIATDLVPYLPRAFKRISRA